MVVQRGPVGVKGSATIHFSPVTSKSKKYDSYLVIYYQGGVRHRLRFNEYAKAFSKAEEIATELSNGQQEAFILSGEARRIYQAALQTLEKIGSPPLDVAVREYSAAKQKLGEDSLLDAATFFKIHAGTKLKDEGLEEIRKKFLAALKADGRSAYHITSISRHTGRFVQHFGSTPIAEVQTGEVNEWLRSLPGGGRNRNNHRNSVHNFFNFAQSEGYLPPNLPTALATTKLADTPGKDNEVFTTEEASTLLKDAPEWLIPTLAIKLFSGMRSEEVFKLDWAAIKFEQDVILLSKSITKTKLRRSVPLLPNLKKWLAPFSKPEGLVAKRWSSPKTMCLAWTQRAARVGVTYKKNAMRNSYISYRLAIVKNIAHVALESGNSPSVIQRDYLELVTEQEAIRWFSIMPDSSN